MIWPLPWFVQGNGCLLSDPTLVCVAAMVTLHGMLIIWGSPLRICVACPLLYYRLPSYSGPCVVIMCLLSLISLPLPSSPSSFSLSPFLSLSLSSSHSPPLSLPLPPSLSPPSLSLSLYLSLLFLFCLSISPFSAQAAVAWVSARITMCTHSVC